MSNDLALFESQLTPLAPQFAEVLAGRMDVKRLIRTIVISVSRNADLLKANRQSLFNAAMSAAVLGLEVDGTTGQAFLIPFKGHAQLVIGYKGFNTLGARSDYTITGAVVRDGDPFEFELGTAAFLKHSPARGNSGRIVTAWAVANSRTRPPIISVLSIEEILAVKERSPGAKTSASPWNDPAIGFPAMAEKSAKRRLARSMPLNVMQLGAALDTAFEERGRLAYIHPRDGLQIEGHAEPLVDSEPSQPTADTVLGPAPELAARARAAAICGEAAFKAFWILCNPVEQRSLKAMGDELRKMMSEAPKRSDL